MIGATASDLTTQRAEKSLPEQAGEATSHIKDSHNRIRETTCRVAGRERERERESSIKSQAGQKDKKKKAELLTLSSHVTPSIIYRIYATRHISYCLPGLG
jgi:hypothetical protein